MMTLNELLDLQTQNVSSLFALLQNETQIIALRNTAEIEKIAKAKMSLIQQIHEQDNELHNQITTDLTAEQTQKINSIQDILSQCHLHNNANGNALERAALSMHKLRNLFTEAMGKDEMTYNGEGQTSSTRTLGTNIKA